MTRFALILAHGQPSDPRTAAAGFEALAAKVQLLLPGWRVAAATLAEPGAISRAIAGRGPGVVFPMFMAGGWFTRVQIPAKLAEAGASGWTVLEPFGCDPAVHDLCVDMVREAEAEAVILAAHGSLKSTAPADIAGQVAGQIARGMGLRVEVGFIDQSPQLASLKGFGAGAVCLPFFAAEGGHVTEDIPRLMAEAGFKGRILPAVGADARVPRLIAAAIQRG